MGTEVKPKSLLLFSGGFDSVVLLHDLLAQDIVPELFFIDYGQRNKNQELDSLMYWVAKHSLEFKVVNLNPIRWSKAQMLKSNELSGDLADDSIQYIEMRNLIFFSYALSYAESRGVKDIYAALLDGQHVDSNMAFAKLFDTLAYQTLGIQLLSPFAFMTKEAVFEYAGKLPFTDLGEILEQSFSCNLSDEFGRPCGECGDCLVTKDFENKLLDTP